MAKARKSRKSRARKPRRTEAQKKAQRKATRAAKAARGPMGSGRSYKHSVAWKKKPAKRRAKKGAAKRKSSASVKHIHVHLNVSDAGAKGGRQTSWERQTGTLGSRGRKRKCPTGKRGRNAPARRRRK